MSTTTVPSGSSTNPSDVTEAPVLFQSDAGLRQYVLNREKKLNALNEPMIDLLRPKLEEWSRSELCQVVVGSAKGRAFCAGGDVAQVVLDAREETTRPRAVEYFRKEFELDYSLAALPKPYVVVMDGTTMGGGFGLSAGAPFRIATEKTVFAMPETNIGYCPDVGATHFLPLLDGELGTYLGLTGTTVRGRDVFELGIATHYIPSSRIPALLERLAALETSDLEHINRTIEELCAERSPEDPPNRLTDDVRTFIDNAFRHDRVEDIVADIESATRSSSEAVAVMAKETLKTLLDRSPTSLKVTLRALRKGQDMSLLDCLRMELGIATAFCSGASPDFDTGVSHVLIEKIKGRRAAWKPDSVEGVSDETVARDFFEPESSRFLKALPRLAVPRFLGDAAPAHPLRFALPTEAEIEHVVVGDHATSGDMAITLEELADKFGDLRPGKVGVNDKIVEVVRRRCKLSEQGYLEWIRA